MNAYTKERRDLREERILDNMLLVQRIARSYSRRVPRYIEVADLESAGTLGLIRAVDVWEPDRGVVFEAFAIKYIRGAVLDHLRAQDPLPYSTRVKIRRVENTSLELQRHLKRFPSDAEIAQRLDSSVAEVSSLMAQAASASLYALDELLDDAAPASHDTEINTRDASSRLEWEQTVKTLMQTIRDLPNNERKIVTLYYFERLKMKEIAAILHVSESRVSQLHARAMTQLRARLREAVEVQE